MIGVSMAWCQIVGLPGMATISLKACPNPGPKNFRKTLQVFANCTQIAASGGTKFGGLASI